MTSSSFAELKRLIQEKNLKTISFDIDGTVYPIRKVELRWWKSLLHSPLKARRFYHIKKAWEKRRKGGGIAALPTDVAFFEEFLSSLLDASLVPQSVREGIEELRQSGVEIYFLSDHGAEVKLMKLGLHGKSINCLTETGELKPHPKISELLLKLGIRPPEHLHVGDRWTDEEQARLLGCEFRYFVSKF
jgi:FMN phosphatase YigB (HAD superfamily)